MLTILDVKTDDGEYSLVHSGYIVEAATVHNVKTEFCELRELAPEKICEALGDWVFVRSVFDTNLDVLRASRGFLSDKIIMNSAMFFYPGSAHKYYQQLLFANHPEVCENSIKTVLVNAREQVSELLASDKICFPFVLKPNNGTESIGVHILRQETDLAKIRDFYDMIIEPYIEPECEWRVYIVGGTMIAAGRSINRLSPDFLNWEPETDTETLVKLREIAGAATSLVGLEYSGVDIIREKGTGKYFILETNILAALALPGFRKVTGEDMSRDIVEWFIERDKFVNQKLPLVKILTDYLVPRIRRLSQNTQDKVRKIMRGEKISTTASEENLCECFADKNLREKLEFLYQNPTTNLRERILDEAENSVSPLGNFLVDHHEISTTGLSTAHTLEKAATLSALYIAIKRPYMTT